MKRRIRAQLCGDLLFLQEQVYVPLVNNKMAERDRKKAEKAGQAPVNEAKKAPLTREEAEAEAERREQESLRKIRESRGQNPK